jgi:hypothetical protein
MAQKEDARDRLKGAGYLGIAGLLTFWSWPLWPGIFSLLSAAAGCCFLFVAGLVALFSVRGKPVEALLATVGLFAALWASARFGPMGSHDALLNSRLFRIQREVEALRSRVGEARVIQALIADRKIGKDLDKRVSESKPPAVSFELTRYGIDDGDVLVFDPSQRFDMFIGANGSFDREWQEWEDYRSLINDSPYRIKELGNGWYLVGYT